MAAIVNAGGAARLPVRADAGNPAGDAIRRKVNSGNVYKGVGTALVVVGGLSVITVAVLAALSATGKGPNILDMGKSVNVSLPGTVAQTSVGALALIGGGIAGFGLLALGGVLIHKGRKKSAEERAAAARLLNPVVDNRTYRQIKNDAFQAFDRYPTGTNKKWIASILGITAAVIGGAVIVAVVLPLFKAMPQVNNMGSLHTAVSASGVHGLQISTGAIVTFSIGAGSAIAGIISAIILAAGVRNAREKERLKQEYLTADNNFNDYVERTLTSLTLQGVVLVRDEKHQITGFDLSNVKATARAEGLVAGSQQGRNAEREAIIAKLEAAGFNVTVNADATIVTLNTPWETGPEGKKEAYKPTLAQLIKLGNDLMAERDTAKKDLATRTQELETAKKALAEAQSRVVALEARPDQAAELAQAREQLAAKAQEVESARKAAGEAEGKVQALQAQVAGHAEVLAQKEEVIRKAHAEVEAVHGHSKEAIKAEQAATDAAIKAARADADKAIAAAEAAAQQARAERDAAEAEVARLQASAAAVLPIAPNAAAPKNASLRKSG